MLDINTLSTLLCYILYFLYITVVVLLVYDFITMESFVYTAVLWHVMVTLKSTHMSQKQHENGLSIQKNYFHPP